MTTLTITKARSSAPPDAAAGTHPKAVIRRTGGPDLVLPFAPRGADLGGWAARWEALDRPGRSPIVLRNGDGLPTLGHTYTIAHADHQQPVEGILADLRKLAESGDRVTLVNLSPQEQGPWRVTEVTVGAELRQQGTNAITRATVGVAYVAAYEAVSTPVKGGHHGGGGGGHHGGGGKGDGITKPRNYTIKKGDTLRKLARRFYGEPSEWRRIAKRNKIKDPGKLKVGRRIVIPADDKKD